jgi:hypothetical protein
MSILVVPICRSSKKPEAQDYTNARKAFNYWLWYVTDTVKAQSELEPPGSDVEPGKHPTHRHYLGEYLSLSRLAVASYMPSADLDRTMRKLPATNSWNPTLGTSNRFINGGRCKRSTLGKSEITGHEMNHATESTREGIFVYFLSVEVLFSGFATH